MGKFEYKDGCLLCNQCGRLSEPPEPKTLDMIECPCGNSESLDALGQLVEIYNPDRRPKGEAEPQK